MGSTRLARKVLADVAGRPLIRRVIERVRAAVGIDDLVVATTTEVEDDELVAALAQEWGCGVFRGSRDDVLERFHDCAVAERAEVIVRITADDPFKDPAVVGRALQGLLGQPRLDYYSNTVIPTYPEGLDVEAFRFSALARAHREAQLKSEREHVTPYIWKHPALFSIANFCYQRDLSVWRWTVDKPNDLEFARAVFGHFADDPLVGFETVVEWLERNPHIRALNANTVRNEGYLQSIENERKP